MTFPWEAKDEETETPPRPELRRDPETGMWPGEAEHGIPDFLRY